MGRDRNEDRESDEELDDFARELGTKDAKDVQDEYDKD